MRLLYAGHTYSITANQAKIAALARLDGLEIALITPNKWKGPLYANNADLFSEPEITNVQHYALKAYFTGKESGFFYSPKLYSIVADFKPDIIHVEQGAYALSYAQILLAAKRSCPNARATFFTWWNLPYEATGFRGILEQFNLRHSACAFAGNIDAEDILRIHGFKRPIHVLPQLGVDPRIFAVDRDENLRKELGLEGYVIGYIGRVAREKGVLDLVEAIGQIRQKRQIMLYIVGSGDALDEVKARASALDVRLVCHPAIRNEEIPRHLALLDTLVLPSRSTPGWVEQFGHILIEAMAADVPVVGSNSGEIPRVIDRAGRIFSEGDVEGLASILDGFSQSEKTRNDLKSLGKARVEKEFTHQRIAEKQMRVYREMLESGKSIGELSAAVTSNGSRTKPMRTG